MVLSRPGALLWTYVANLGIALLFSLRLHAQLSSLLDHSLAAQGLNSAFDLGTLWAVYHRLGFRAPATGATAYAGLPIYLLIYFLLVPGALLCYRIAAPARLWILLSSGICFFWRFVRITVLAVLVSGIVLGSLFFLQSRWADHVDENVVGVSAIYQELPGVVLIVLVASLLRLYFDLVEAYTVQLDGQYRANGKPDRRVRRTLIPAMKTLWRNLPRALGSFVLLALLGVGAVAFTGRIALHMLAQPRVWPGFLVIQAGIFLSLLTRYWQRGAETQLASDYPLGPGVLLELGVELQPSCAAYGLARVQPTTTRRVQAVDWPAAPLDAQSDPEPAAPSLEEPDPGVFGTHGPVTD